jgi:hypothetical protein
MPGPDEPDPPRIVRRPRAVRRPGFSWAALHPGTIWATIRPYLGLGRDAAAEPINTPQALARFVDSRASFVAQTSLYGYLRTRAGMRYPELFDDDAFVGSINIAKWHLWLDCLADLAVHAGGRLARHAPRQVPTIAGLMSGVVDDVIARAGAPAEAGDGFAAHAVRVRDRIRRTDWMSVGPDESAFTQSPDGLVKWAPVMDELKQLDAEVVRNSVRFRWQEVRREFARELDADVLLATSRRPAIGR